MAGFSKPRALQSADLVRAAEIERDTFGDPWSFGSFAETLARPEVHGFAVEEEAGTLVGYALCALAGEEAEILNLAVDQRARGRGVGRSMVTAILDDLGRSGARRVYLEVRCSNAAAIGLYRSFGFRPLGRRRGYYVRPREDALTMVVDILAAEHPSGGLDHTGRALP